jgi:hypothetical protein
LVLAEDALKARREIYGDDDEEGERRAGGSLHVFEHDGCEAAWPQRLGWRVAPRHGRGAADRLVNDVSGRRQTIRYPEFRSKGRQIGSGPPEATCNTLTARLKCSGMRWDGDNAGAIRALEVVTRCDQGDSYWSSHLQQTA